MTPTDPIAAIRAEVEAMERRAQNATPAPWTVYQGYNGWHVMMPTTTDAELLSRGNAEFKAAARTDVPRLVALVEALCDALEEAPECGHCDEEHMREYDNADSVAVRVDCGYCSEFRAALAKLTTLMEER